MNANSLDYCWAVLSMVACAYGAHHFRPRGNGSARAIRRTLQRLQKTNHRKDARAIHQRTS